MTTKLYLRVAEIGKRVLSLLRKTDHRPSGLLYSYAILVYACVTLVEGCVGRVVVKELSPLHDEECEIVV